MSDSRPLPPPDEIFWKRIDTARKRILFLDYDGTLAPFHENRYEAVPYPGVRMALHKVMDAGNSRVVLVSGRWTKDLPPLLGLKSLPEIWGSHGMERLYRDGRLELAPLEEKEIIGLATADDWFRDAGLLPLTEHKPGCLALHWRSLDDDDRNRIEKRARKTLDVIARANGLVLKEFDGGLELRAPARDKGDAVRTVLSEEGPDARCAYLGDDLTDEDAFRAVGDRGLGILVRKTWRPTAASAWLKPPEELIEFLERWWRLQQHT